MAILNNLETIYSASFKEAYHRIIEVNYDFTLNKITFKVAIYVDQKARDNNFPPIYIRKITTDIIADPRKELYKYLKTTTDYQETKDI